MGSKPCRRLSLVGIAHPIAEPLFRYKEFIGRRRSDEVVIVKKADMWP